MLDFLNSFVILPFIKDKWFDLTFLFLVLLLEYKNVTRNKRFEKKINVKLKKIKEELEYTNHLVYSLESDKFEEEKESFN